MKNEKLEAARVQIDEIDRQMVALFIRRMNLSDEIADIKQENNISLINYEREESVIESAITASNPDLKGETITFMRALMSLSKSRQRKKLYGTAEEYNFPPSQPGACVQATVSLYGASGGNGEKAAALLFSDAELSQMETYESVFSAVKNKKSGYGVVPLENALTGGIGEVYDLLRKYGCYIVGQTWVDGTRFIVIGSTPEYDENSDTVSVIFRTAHRSGALVDALFPIMSEEVNMKRLESRPTSDGKYCFFCDLEGNIMDKRIANALKNAAASCGYMEVLGCYRENTIVR